jgi:hypothetical protein
VAGLSTVFSLYRQGSSHPTWIATGHLRSEDDVIINGSINVVFTKPKLGVVSMINFFTHTMIEYADYKQYQVLI